MSLSTCVMSGTAVTAAGVGTAGLWMRWTIGAPGPGLSDYPTLTTVNARRSNDGTVFNGMVVIGAPEVIWTGVDGAFSVTLPQGATFRVEAPWADLDHVGTVPSTSTASFADVFINCQRWPR